MFPGFNRRKRGSVNKGDWDRDGVTNLKDCDAMNFRKQDGGEVFDGDIDSTEILGSDAVSMENRQLMTGYAPGEHELIKERLEQHRLKKKFGGKK